MDRVSRAFVVVVTTIALASCCVRWFAAGTRTGSSTGTVAWQPAADDIASARRSSVPLDWSRPRARTSRSHLARRRPTATGSACCSTNPGGPGGSGIDVREARDRHVLQSRSLDRFDIVSWDPRGVGASAPVSVRSEPRLLLRRRPRTPPTPRPVARATRRSRSGSSPTAAHDSARLLPYVSTAATVARHGRDPRRDGRAQIDYLGFSYGTYLGALYAQTVPDARARDGARRRDRPGSIVATTR